MIYKVEKLQKNVTNSLCDMILRIKLYICWRFWYTEKNK